MRILFFIDSLTAGGKERRLTELMKALNLRPGIDFELVVMKNEVHYKEVLNLNIHIHYLIRKTKKDISAFKKFYTICKAYKPDIVHCWNSMTAIIAIPACTLLHIKLVNGMVVDTPVKQNAFNKNWLRAQISFFFSSMIIGNSNAGLLAYSAPLKKSVCIYNGMDLLRFKNLKESKSVLKDIFEDIPPDVFIAGMVAAFQDRKDYETLIKAALILTKSNNIRFVLVGDGSNFKEIKSSIPALLSDKIIFLGKRSDVESIIQIFDTGILLTNTKVHGEGISNSIIEYMASAKPVIATRGGGTDEVVINNETGYLIDPKNKDQLIEKIRLLMKDSSLAKELGRKGYEKVQKKFDLKIMTDHYVSAYQKLLKNKKN